MNKKITQLLSIALISMSCNKAPATEAPTTNNSGNRSIQKLSCTTPSIANNFDIDSCAIDACEIAGGEYTENGCECQSGETFIMEDEPKCVSYTKSVGVNRREKEEHEYINYSSFTKDDLYSIDIYNYDVENEVEDLFLPNFVAPNFLTLRYLNPAKTIAKKFVDNARKNPNIFIRKTFGDISPIESIRFNEYSELSFEAPFYDYISHVMDTEFEASERYYYSEKGCLEHCKKSMSFDFDQIIAKRTREYFKGILAFDYIEIRNREEFILSAKVDLLARTILTLNKGNADSLKVKYTLFPFSMQTSGESLESIIDENEDLQIKKVKRYNWGNVILCDNGVLPNDKNLSRDINLERGPNDNSLYGWLDQVRDQSDFYNGAINIDQLASGVKGASEHGRSVINYMKMVNVASISLNSCLGDFDNWVNNTFEHDYKVVNYSYSDYLDNKACLSNHHWNKVKKHPKAKRMLWVFAAGNEKSYLTPETATLCPQNIVTRDTNALIVGASPEFGGVTNRGKTFVDLFADAPSTSTATAIVSSLAANLLKLYPSLSVSDVKKALLASVEDTGLSSRTGGVLDKDLAYKAAKEINKNRNINNLDLLREVHCNGRRYFCKVDESWEERF